MCGSEIEFKLPNCLNFRHISNWWWMYQTKNRNFVEHWKAFKKQIGGLYYVLLNLLSILSLKLRTNLKDNIRYRAHVMLVSLLAKDLLQVELSKFQISPLKARNLMFWDLYLTQIPPSHLPPSNGEKWWKICHPFFD